MILFQEENFPCFSLFTCFVTCHFVFLFHRAIKRFSAAVRVDPTYLRGYVCRAEAYEQVGHVRTFLRNYYYISYFHRNL